MIETIVVLIKENRFQETQMSPIIKSATPTNATITTLTITHIQHNQPN